MLPYFLFYMLLDNLLTLCNVYGAKVRQIESKTLIFSTLFIFFFYVSYNM